MLKVLLRKQLAEVFRSFFYDAKKNKMRSKAAIVCWFFFYTVLMIGILGGIFTMLSMSLCGPLAEAGMGWLYFLLISIIAIFLGAFGSVFNTYSGLYLGKDNDLLLSLPIPVQTIITARLMNVYLMGTMYSAAVLLPALIIYWVEVCASAVCVLCGMLLFLNVTLIVLLLSCLLGWAVARISLRLKNKSFITVLAALVFIAAYYYLYFKANDLIKDIILNAQTYGSRIMGSAYLLFQFGRIGEGNIASAAAFLAVLAVLLALTRLVLSRTFLGIASSGGSIGKTRYVEKQARQRSVFGALLAKELARFTSSPNYMLNCGLGLLLLPALGILLLIKGSEVFGILERFFADRPGTAAVLFCSALCLFSSMNSMAVPSVSLEGKSLWLPLSLPVRPQTVLRAKLAMQLVLTSIPVVFAAVCAAFTVPSPFPVRLLVCLMPAVFTVFSAAFGTAIGTRMPLLSWTSEIVPIKQSGATLIVLFGTWVIGAAFAGLWFLAGWRIGAGLFLLLSSCLLAAVTLFLLRWLDTCGSRIFTGLSA